MQHRESSIKVSAERARLARLEETLPISVSLPWANDARQRLEKTGPAVMADVNTALCPRRAIVVNPSLVCSLVFSHNEW